MAKFKVAYEESGDSKPRPHERETAELLARLFQSNLIFMRRSSSKTPDLYVLKTDIRWELKSPTGGGKHTVQNNLREASKQSENIILDLTRSKMTDIQGISRAKDFILHERSRIKCLKILKKDGTIIDIK
jgi:hypothetical protein